MRIAAVMNRLLTSMCFSAGLLGALGAAPQPPAERPPASAAPPAPASAQPPAAGAAATPPAPAYTYTPDGRRDPFISLVGRGSDPRTSGNRPTGLPGLLITEISVKGILKDRSGFMAMIQGPDKRTYIVRPGDKLLDGSVKSIVEDAVVFSQDVNDPLSLVKQREIRKSLRSSEESRG
jgi:type IV pilus assembly protein PilP